MGGRRRCCCPAGCEIASDLFDREDSDDPGPLWDERDADWDIDTNELAERGNADSLCILIPYHARYSWHVTAGPGLSGLEANAKYWLVANYKDDSNFHHAEFFIDTANSQFTISLYRNMALIKSETFAYDMTGKLNTFEVCLSETHFMARLNPVDAPTYCVVAFDSIEGISLIADGYRTGLGNGAAVAITFDGYSASELLDTHQECPTCYCGCALCFCLDPVPGGTLTISGDCWTEDQCVLIFKTEDCAGIDALWCFCFATSTDIFVVGCDEPIPSYTLLFTLYCLDDGADPPGTWKLRVWVTRQGVSPPDPAAYVFELDPLTIDCDTGTFTFPGFDLDYLDNISYPCCTVTGITIDVCSGAECPSSSPSASVSSSVSSSPSAS